MFCLPFCVSCETMLTLMPGLLAMFWPVVVAVFGAETLMRQSLIICLYFVVSDMFGQFWSKTFRTDYRAVAPAVNLVILLTLFGQSYVRTPGLIITVCGFLVTNLAPVILWIEVRQSVKLVTNFGQYMAQEISSADDDDDSDSNLPSKQFILKCAVLAATVASHVLGFVLIGWALTSARTLLFTYAAIILVCFQLVQLVVTYFVEDGIISDPALVFVMSCFALYLSVYEDNIKTNINANITSDTEWLESRLSFTGKSLIYQLLSLPDVSTVYINEGLRWAKHHYGLWFWLALIIRITCVITWLIDHYDGQFNQDNDNEGWLTSGNDYDDDDSDDHPIVLRFLRYIPALTVIKVVVIIIYTQTLLQQLPIVEDSWPSVCPQAYQSLLRLIQCFALGIHYFHTLYVSTGDHYDSIY
ncbi:uncharacterized protein LOC128953965 [Oppia nitens]|uniref:uncharacterized protein LOC128953965 n=1 Tax=Oppia nitens TaxID=1686743 RepID=UPI0023DBE1C0|nr:uncharacterized protein LOC128953965 [Oppia nitens]